MNTTTKRKRQSKCDLRIAKRCENGRYKFWLNERQFVLVCAECIGVLVRNHWACPECGLTDGHKILCKTGNQKARKYQKNLK